MNRKLILPLALCAVFGLGAENQVSEVWSPDASATQYRNPIIYADYSDPDAIRVGDDYYMTSSSFNCIPGLQILHSKDLIHWELIGAAIPEALEPRERYDTVQHGGGVWAPCIRYHNGEFYIFWGDPDVGIFMVKAKDPRGPWTAPHLVKAAKGIIDTSPLWDEDGRVYLSHGYAGSRAELKSILAVCELNSDATEVISGSRIVFDGHEKHETVEGTKFHKYNGYYYILCPAGGVPTGWQLALRSKTPYGPYEDRIVMAQGKSPINGPHQGAWIDTPEGENWFMHFQDVGEYGRIIHLQPMVWKDGWPVIGEDKDGDGCGDPVLKWKKPIAGNFEAKTPAESDEFDNIQLGLQWQWHANYNPKWIFCDAANSRIRLYSYPVPEDYKSMWDVSNLLLQKTPSNAFTATTKIDFKPIAKYKGERTGLIVMGRNYGGLFVENTDEGLVLSQVECAKADKGKTEKVNASVKLTNGEVYLRVVFDKKAQCKFYYSLDGKKFSPLGTTFQSREGQWIGAKVGLFCTRPHLKSNDGGWVDVDWFRITKK